MLLGSQGQEKHTSLAALISRAILGSAIKAGVAFLLAFVSLAAGQSMRDFKVPTPAPENSVLVVGFLGGFEHWDDPHRGVRKVAMAIRSLRLPNVYVETIENHRRKLALKLIGGAINSARQSRGQGGSRIILYGQSWGGSAVVSTARDLQALGVRVALTVQVDSVGLRDSVVPANVLNAANLFEGDLFGIGGRKEIRAENPQSTRILENTRLTYLFRPFSTFNSDDLSWARRRFGGSHAKMEADEFVWAHVQELIVRSIRGNLSKALSASVEAYDSNVSSNR
jgi:pimeloyl-ACP methyl ester carboxylesterase